MEDMMRWHIYLAWARRISLFAAVIVAAHHVEPACEAATEYEPAVFDTSAVVATVGDDTLTLGMLRYMVVARRVFAAHSERDRDRRRDLLEAWIEQRLFAHEASRFSLKGAHGALARVRRALLLIAGNLYASEHYPGKLLLDSATIDTFYHNHITRYTTTEDHRRVRVITVFKTDKNPVRDTTGWRDTVYYGWYPEDKIDSIYARLKQGEDFLTLGAAHTEDPLHRGTAGDYGWSSLYSLGSGAFAKKIWEQPLYLISGPFETDNAWHIIQVVGERPAGPLALNDELRADILQHLSEQQVAKFTRELSDSLFSMAHVRFDSRTRHFEHERLKPEMVLAIVNERDTIYAAEFLDDQHRWIDHANNMLPSPEQREEIVSGDYVRGMCWYGFLRDQGYLDRPEVEVERQRLLRQERTSLAQLASIIQTDYDPDSAEVIRYFESNRQLYGNAPNALSFSWNTIRSKLQSDHLDSLRKKRMLEAEARWGVWRDLERLDQLPLLVAKKKPKTT